MSIANANFPAFPWEQSPGNQNNLGLSKREWFAGMAMQGVLASCPDGMRVPEIHPTTIEAIARFSVECADSLLAELDKKQP